jgi:transcriptional regulator with XRE-family HTH domain
MSSLATSQTPYKAISGKRTLQRLRRQAGFRSAKDFAEALGIPGSTYARYERAGDGADCGICGKDSLIEADLDLLQLVDLEDIDAPEPEGIQPRYDALSADGRALVDSYLSYVELGERAARSQGRR